MGGNNWTEIIEIFLSKDRELFSKLNNNHSERVTENLKYRQRQIDEFLNDNLHLIIISFTGLGRVESEGGLKKDYSYIIKWMEDNFIIINLFLTPPPVS